MSVEERLARLETSQAGQEKWLSSIDGKVDEHAHKLTKIGTELGNLKTATDGNTGKLDRLVKAADMGEGAWWAAVKIGAFLTIVVTGALGLLDKIRGIFH